MLLLRELPGGPYELRVGPGAPLYVQLPQETGGEIGPVRVRQASVGGFTARQASVKLRSST